MVEVSDTIYITEDDDSSLASSAIEAHQKCQNYSTLFSGIELAHIPHSGYSNLLISGMLKLYAIHGQAPNYWVNRSTTITLGNRTNIEDTMTGIDAGTISCIIIIRRPSVWGEPMGLLAGNPTLLAQTLLNPFIPKNGGHFQLITAYDPFQ